MIPMGPAASAYVLCPYSESGPRFPKEQVKMCVHETGAERMIFVKLVMIFGLRSMECLLLTIYIMAESKT